MSLSEFGTQAALEFLQENFVCFYFQKENVQKNVPMSIYIKKPLPLFDVHKDFSAARVCFGLV